MSRAVLSRIRRWQLTLRLDTDARFTAKQAAKAFSGAEYLRLHVWQSTYDGVDERVGLGLFRGVRGVGVARVTGCAEELARELEASMMSDGEWDDSCCCEKRDENRCTCCGGKLDCGGR